MQDCRNYELQKQKNMHTSPFSLAAVKKLFSGEHRELILRKSRDL